ncbi:hypothetical protein [Botrimarina hoheduenensis]|uniref:hypothetical protein n=1 Tax=Botrimarina hoheduenensis TaxID=2528000 RepID=UPI0011B6D5B7|nr:hypothetical protein [Botrimarina hoheduenensis]
MNDCPEQIDDARVIAWAMVNQDIVPTGNTTHRVGGEVAGPCAGLAICSYDNDRGFYLFYCDERWEPATDTWHQTLDDAKAQAAFEYSGIEDHWREAV